MNLKTFLVASLLSSLCYFGQSCNKQTDPDIVTPTDTLDNDSLPSDPEDIITGYLESHETAQAIYVPTVFPGEVYALNAADGQILWSAVVEGNYGSPVIATDSTIAFRGNTHIITALDKNGLRRWTFDLQTGDYESALVADKGVIFAESNEFVYAIDDMDGSVKWKLTKPSNNVIYAGLLSIANGVLYSVNKTYIRAINKESGMLIWESEYISDVRTSVIFPTRIFAAAGKSLYILDTKTGKIIESYHGVLESGSINVKYGRIFQPGGNVIDSANPYKVHPRIQQTFSSWMPYRSPLLADGLAMGPIEISNAMTGVSYCEPFFRPDFTSYRSLISGATYLNDVLYYPSGERTMYSGDGAQILYSEVYAFDVKKKVLKWRTLIDDSGLLNTEPCIVTREGTTVRGTDVFR